MGRWTQEDEVCFSSPELLLLTSQHLILQDDYRLPEGMKRTGYDADTGRYYFTDQDGSVWEGAQGAQFSEMTLGTLRISSMSASNTMHHVVSEGSPRPSRIREHEDNDPDVETAPARSDGYQPLTVDPASPSILHLITAH